MLLFVQFIKSLNDYQLLKGHIFFNLQFYSRLYSKIDVFRSTFYIYSLYRYTLSGGRLTISKPTEEMDAGYYQCEADNDIGKILSAIAQVSFGCRLNFIFINNVMVIIYLGIL